MSNPSKSSSNKQSNINKKLIFLETMLDLSQESEEALKNKDLSFQDKLYALSRFNTAQKNLYGENSINAFRSEANLGFFLNEHKEPELAIKHLNIANSLSKNIDKIEEEETMKIAIETANAYLSIDKKHTEQAEEALKPYSDTQISAPHLRYKRDLAKSQICLYKKDFNNALKNIKSAQESFLAFSRDSNKDPQEEVKLSQTISKIVESQKYDSKNYKTRSTTTRSIPSDPIPNTPGTSPNRVQFVIPQNTTKPTEPTPEASTDSTPSYLQNFELLDSINQGAFGKVYRVKDKNTGEIYAAKISKQTVIDNQESKLNLKREVNILSKLNHPAVLKFICYSPLNFKNKPKPVIITEYAANHSLYDLIKMERDSLAHKDWDDTHKVITLYGIASAMSFLHDNNIIHRDLKPSNILMDEHLHPKIADFGLSKINHNEQSMTTKSIAGQKGTPIYMAPEIWKDSKYSEASDVYAFGMIMYEVITTEQPFIDITDLPKKVIDGIRPSFKDDVSDAYRYLIESCWDEDVTKRPTFHDIADQLRGDPGFHEFDTFDDDEFDKYIDFIDDYEATFSKDPNKDISQYIASQAQSFKVITIDIPAPVQQPEVAQPAKTSKLLCPDEYYQQLDDDRKHLIEEAEDDPIKQCIVGQFLVEGIEGFPQETDVGIQYLDKAIKAGCTEACTYYCNLLIRGQFVDYNLELAEKYLETQLKSHDGTVYLLYGRVMRKFEKFDEARRYFKKGANQGNNEAMYEYGKMCYRGEGAEKNEEEANAYFDLAKKNGNYKAYEFIFKQQKEEERRKKREQKTT